LSLCGLHKHTHHACHYYADCAKANGSTSREDFKHGFPHKELKTKTESFNSDIIRGPKQHKRKKQEPAQPGGPN
jgi:hypothetical protein